MAANKLINFRCPDDLLTAIEAYGREHYPTNPNGRGNTDFDQSKALRDILISGVESLTNGEVKLERKVEKPKSNYVELLDRIAKLEAQQAHPGIEARLEAIESALSGKYLKIQSLIPDLMGIVDGFNADS
jgi:hypothetical protein